MLRILHYFCRWIIGLLAKSKFENIVKLWNKAFAACFEMGSKTGPWGRNENARNVFKSSPYKGCDRNADLRSTKVGMLIRIFSWNSLLYKNIHLQHVFVLVLMSHSSDCRCVWYSTKTIQLLLDVAQRVSWDQFRYIHYLQWTKSTAR
jgi:hypothetical protein